MPNANPQNQKTPPSIRKRLTWYVIATMTSMSVISGALVYRGTLQEADEIFNASLVQTARVLEGLLTRQSIAANHTHLETALSRYATINPVENNDDGHEYEKALFFAVRDDQANILIKSHFAPALSGIKDSNGFNRLTTSDEDWITFTLRSREDDLWIIVGERTELRDEIVEYIGQSMLLPLLLLLPLIILLLWKLIRNAMTPLKKVTTQVQQQNLKQLTAIEDDGVPIEITPLVEAFNSMLNKLNVAYTREQRFVSNASHELRNPLAALLINVDNALEESSDPDLDESLDSMKQSIKRLSHLITQLLELSHSENPLNNQSFETVELNTLCQEAVDRYQATAKAKEQRLHCDLSQEKFTLNGNPNLLRSLFSNLLDNAVKYCADGNEILLSSKTDGKDIIITIDDSGKGLTTENRAKAMNRFYRGGNSKVEGAGLGLSIVKSIADIHSANIELSQSKLGGLCVTLRFMEGDEKTSELLLN